MSIFESNYLIGYVDRKWAEILSIYYDSLVSVFMMIRECHYMIQVNCNGVLFSG